MTDSSVRSRPAEVRDQGGVTAFRCSARSGELGEPELGTASTVRSWLLVEQPGAWPQTALDSRQIPRDVAVALSRAANRHGVRLVLIRRPGRSPAGAGRPITCYLAHTGRVDPWLAQLEVPGLASVLELDLAALAAGKVPSPAVRVGGPLFCVCTHGSHDPCCAERGRPVATALAARFPQRTWEVSHIGGDRFAANVVCFPHGVYLGRVPAETAAEVGHAYAQGHLSLEHLRGRASDPPTVQAADSHLRRHLGLTRIDATAAVSRAVRDDVETVTFQVRHAPGAVARLQTVRLRVSAATPARALTCHAGAQGRPPAYQLLDIVPG